MVIGITCALFFALAICHLSLYLQLSGGVILSDYCQNPEEAQNNFIEMPGKSHSESRASVSATSMLVTDVADKMCWRQL